jgi:hypothetical protein
MNRTEWRRTRAGALALVTLVVLPVAGTWPWALQAQASERRTDGAAVQLFGPSGTLRGELVAASPEGIWIRNERREFVLVPLDQVREARVQRHAWTPRRVMIWTGIAGGLTTVGMLAACRAYDGSDSSGCGSFALGWAGAWAVVGGVSTALVSPAWERISPRNTEGLRPWARFPQGLPPGVLPASPDTVVVPDPPPPPGPSG